MKKLIAVAIGMIVAGVAYASISCGIDGQSMYFTGNTRIEMGKLLYEYKCPTGHTSWVVQ